MTLDVHTPLNPRAQSRGRKKQITWRMVSLVLLAVVLAFWVGHATVKFFLDDSVQQGQGRDLTSVPSEVIQMKKKNKRKNKSKKTTTGGPTSPCPSLKGSFVVTNVPVGVSNDNYVITDLSLTSSSAVTVTGTNLAFYADVANGGVGPFDPLDAGTYPFSPDAFCQPGGFCTEDCSVFTGAVSTTPTEVCGWAYNSDSRNFPPCQNDNCVVKAVLALTYKDGVQTCYQLIETANYPTTSCFHPSSMILMADNTERLVTTLQPGDMIMGLHGPETVILASPAFLGDRVWYSVNGRSGGVSEDHAFANANFSAGDPYEKLVLNVDLLLSSAPEQASYTRQLEIGDSVWVWDAVSQQTVMETVTSIDEYEDEINLKLFSVMSNGYGAIAAGGVFTANYYNDWQKTGAMYIMRDVLRWRFDKKADEDRYVRNLVDGYLHEPFENWIMRAEDAILEKYRELINAQAIELNNDYEEVWKEETLAYRTEKALSLSKPYETEPKLGGRTKIRARYVEGEPNHIGSLPLAEGLALIDTISDAIQDWWENEKMCSSTNTVDCF